MREIPLTRGYVAIVDDEDYEPLADYLWHVRIERDGRCYAHRSIPNGKRRQTKVQMHRVILAAPAPSAKRLRLQTHIKENEMDIDTLTVKQLREIQSMCGVAKKKTKRRIEEKRVVLVVDRGWIFAGDQALTGDGYIQLSDAVHVFRWEKNGFSWMLENWKDASVTLKKVKDVEVPADSIIFRVPVEPGWGLK